MPAVIFIRSSIVNPRRHFTRLRRCYTYILQTRRSPKCSSMEMNFIYYYIADARKCNGGIFVLMYLRGGVDAIMQVVGRTE